MICQRNGQTVLEYSILVMIVIAALLTMQVYIKRGMQGRWRTSVDDMGEQFDPRATRGTITKTFDLRSGTNVYMCEQTDPVTKKKKFVTMRQDYENTVERTDGDTWIDRQRRLKDGM